MTYSIKKYKKQLLLVCFLLVLGMFYSLNTNAAIRSIVDDKQSDKELVDNKSCWAKGYRKTCPAGLEGADSCKQNGKTYYKDCGKCETDGYFKSCPSDQVKGSKLDCNAEYSKCECKPEYKYGPGREKCDLVPSGKCTSDGKDYYSQCSCDAKYKYRCNATGLKGGAKSCGEGSSKKYETCVCSEKSIVENGYTCDQVQSEGFTCYINCKLAPVKTCESITGNYVTTCPAGQEGTSVTVDGLSCKKDCKAPLVMTCDTLITKINNTLERGIIEINNSITCTNKTLKLKDGQILKGVNSSASIDFIMDNQQNGIVLSNLSELSDLNINYISGVNNRNNTEDKGGIIRIPTAVNGVVLKNLNITQKYAYPLSNYVFPNAAIKIGGNDNTTDQIVELVGTINIIDKNHIQKYDYKNGQLLGTVATYNVDFTGIKGAFKSRSDGSVKIKMVNATLNIDNKSSFGAYALDEVFIDAKSSNINITIEGSGGIINSNLKNKGSNFVDTILNIEKKRSDGTAPIYQKHVSDLDGCSMNFSGNSLVNIKNVQNRSSIAGSHYFIVFNDKSKLNIKVVKDTERNTESISSAALDYAKIKLYNDSQVNIYMGKELEKGQTAAFGGEMYLYNNSQLNVFSEVPLYNRPEYEYWGAGLSYIKLHVYSKDSVVRVLSKNTMTFGNDGGYRTIVVNMPLGFNLYTKFARYVSNKSYINTDRYKGVFLIDDLSLDRGNVTPSDNITTHFNKNTSGRLTSMPSTFNAIFTQGIFAK